jgi:hypothetical protein
MPRMEEAAEVDGVDGRRWGADAECPVPIDGLVAARSRRCQIRRVARPRWLSLGMP